MGMIEQRASRRRIVRVQGQVEARDGDIGEVDSEGGRKRPMYQPSKGALDCLSATQKIR